MEPVIVENVEIEVDLDKIRRKLKIKKNDPIDKDLINLYNDIKKVGKPKGIYSSVEIDLIGENYIRTKDTILYSRILKENLKNTRGFFPYISTIGTDLEKWYKNIEVISEQYISNIILQEICYKMKEIIIKDIKNNFHISNVSTMNPGTLKDWKLSERDKLLQLFKGVEKRIGVKTLNDNLISPTISVYGIVFEDFNDYNNCRLCTKENCPNRSADFLGFL
jgi:hypothetical protein